MEVRDYECDIEGIVNNANYLHYTEHTRHLFLRSLGVSFAQLHERGIDAVVARMNLQYKTPLRCDDEFISRLWLENRYAIYLPPRHFPCQRRETQSASLRGTRLPHQRQTVAERGLRPCLRSVYKGSPHPSKGGA